MSESNNVFGFGWLILNYKTSRKNSILSVCHFTGKTTQTKKVYIDRYITYGDNFITCSKFFPKKPQEKNELGGLC